MHCHGYLPPNLFSRNVVKHFNGKIRENKNHLSQGFSLLELSDFSSSITNCPHTRSYVLEPQNVKSTGLEDKHKAV